MNLLISIALFFASVMSSCAAFAPSSSLLTTQRLGPHRLLFPSPFLQTKNPMMHLILNLHHLQMNQKQSSLSIHLSYLSLKNSDAISEQIEAVNAVLSTPPMTENKVSDRCRGLCNNPGGQLDTMKGLMEGLSNKKANMLDFN